MGSISRRVVAGSIGALGALAASGCAHAFAAKDYVGTWSGTLAGRLRLKLVIADVHTATLYSLDQGGEPIPATAVALGDDKIMLEFAVLGAKYEGRLSGADTLTGTLTQGGRLPLDFKRGDLFAGHAAARPAPLTAQALSAKRQKAGVPAIGAAFARDGGAATVFADGLRSVDAAVPVTADDLWHLGSITKSMTATLVARMVESGGITWETRVGDILGAAVPKMQDSYKAATFRHLLSHHAGLQPDIGAVDLIRFPFDGEGNPADRLKWAAIALAQTPTGVPGVNMVYSNNGYIIAGAMLETVYKKSWETLIVQEVFRPLKLASAGFGAPGTAGKLDQPLGHKAKLFDANTLKPLPVGPGQFADNPVALGPAGRVHMNLRDLTTFLDAHLLQPADFLKPESWQTLHTPPFGGDYAMGWTVQSDGTLWHNGSNTFWYAEIAVDPAKKIVAAVTCNDGVMKTSQPAVGDVLASALATATQS